jgi:branched-chain amino acid transport system ATP-binding protein
VLLEAHDVTMNFSGFTAVHRAAVTLNAGEIVGLIGPNGAGKSTFFGCLVGDLRPTEGKVSLEGRDITYASAEAHAQLGIARTFQVPQTFENMTVLDNVMVGAFLRHPGRAAARKEAWEVLEFTGLKDVADQPAKILGTPGRKRLEIARALATRPRVLLLDEALAGLTPAEIQKAIALVRQIHARGITLLIVEHIMEVIMNLAQRVIVFNQGQIISQGEPRQVVRDPEVIAAYLGRAHRPSA